jgi:hypothetical protein
MSTEEQSEFNTGGEIFAAWVLVLSVLFMTGVLYYFTVVRVPAHPIFEKVFNLLAIPPGFQSKVEQGILWVKVEFTKKSQDLIGSLSKNVPPDMKPLSTNDLSPVHEMRGTSEDMAAAIIGVPLEEDDDETLDEKQKFDSPQQSPMKQQQKQQQATPLVDF